MRSNGLLYGSTFTPSHSIDSRHIDGHDYMWALSELLDDAREAIFILVGFRGV